MGTKHEFGLNSELKINKFPNEETIWYSSNAKFTYENLPSLKQLMWNITAQAHVIL